MGGAVDRDAALPCVSTRWRRPARRRYSSAPMTFAYEELLPIGAPRRDAVPAGHDGPRLDLRGGGQDVPRGRARGADAAHARGDARHRAPAAARPPRAAARRSSTTPRRRRTTASSRSSCSRTRTSPPAACCPSCQDTGTAIVMGKKGQYVFTGGGDEAAIARGIFDTYRDGEPALLADRAARHVQGEEHRQRTCRRRSRSSRPTATRTSSCSWPRAAARRTRASCSRRPRRCSTRRACSAFLDAEAALARHRGVPAVPPRDRHRRHVGRAHAQDREARVGALPRHAARRAATTLGRALPRPRARGRRSSRSRSATGIGAQFGGKYFCHDVRVIRLPRHGASLPGRRSRVSCSADRQALGKITQRRRVPRAARDRSGEVPARASTHDELARRGREDRSRRGR